MNSSLPTPAFLKQQLTHTLGQSLSESDWSFSIAKLSFLKPDAGKRFWQSAGATTGIYIILAGKVRVLDNNDNLLVTLEVEDSFGALTLFSEEAFMPYAARASVNLHLCYIPSELLQSLWDKYPAIREHLYHQAVLQDLLLFCRQIEPFDKAQLKRLLEILPLLERQTLEAGNSANHLLREKKLFLIRRGELKHSSGKNIIAGNFHIVSKPA